MHKSTTSFSATPFGRKVGVLRKSNNSIDCTCVMSQSFSSDSPKQKTNVSIPCTPPLESFECYSPIEDSNVFHPNLIVPSKSADLPMNYTFETESLFPNISKQNGISYIGIESLINLVNSHYPYQFIDCRFPYEYKGGYIGNAINIWNEELLIQYYDSQRSKNSNDSIPQKPILLLYCEFSKARCVKITNNLRNYDMTHSCDSNLLFPEMYIIEGGFVEVFHSYNDICNGCYTTMTDSSYTQQMRLCSLISGTISNSPRARSFGSATPNLFCNSEYW